jgi:hypothetical protein
LLRIPDVAGPANTPRAAQLTPAPATDPINILLSLLFIPNSFFYIS